MLKHTHYLLKCTISRDKVHHLTERNIAKWLKSLVKAMDMKILDGPHCASTNMPGNTGVTGIVIISTSHIVIHVFTDDPFPIVHLDVYSCSDFDKGIILFYLRRLVGNHIIINNEMFVNRDANFQSQVCQTMPPSSNQIIPSITQRPVILMNFPWTLALDEPNSAYMHELKQNYEKTRGDGTWAKSLSKPKAMTQFMKVYSQMAEHSLIYLLPSLGNFQDQPYVANLGSYLHHLPESRIIILSNYSAPGREGEEVAAKPFLRQLGYTLVDCPYHFEGEAELKYLGGNTYVGGYGQFSDNRAFDWMSKNFDMKIIRLKLRNSDLYHLDCSLLPITREITLVVTDLYTSEELAELTKYTTIVSVPLKLALADSPGITNSVRLGSTLFTDTVPGTPQFTWLKNFCQVVKLKVIHVDITEFHKSAANVSCMVMALNTPPQLTGKNKLLN